MPIQEVFTVTSTIVTDTNIYASGDFIGTGILTLSEVGMTGGAKLMSLAVTELDTNGAAIDFLFFRTVCANTTFTNNGALDIHDTDLPEFIGGVSLVAGDYFALADNRVACKRDIHLLMTPASTSTALYCVPVSRGTPTYSASALTVKFTFCRE